MKTKRSTTRSFPGRLTLEEWRALPDIGRRDLIHRAACEALDCYRLCASKQCRRHRTCCGDDAMDCELRLRRLVRPRVTALQRELGRLRNLAALRGAERQTSKDAPRSTFWMRGLDDPWNAPPSPFRALPAGAASDLPPWKPAQSGSSGEGG